MHSTGPITVHYLSWNEPVTPSEEVAVWNAHRPLLGAHSWESQSRYGIFYAAEDVASPVYGAMALHNAEMDARRVEVVNNAEVYARAAASLEASGYTLQGYVDATGLDVAEAIAHATYSLGLPWHALDDSADALLAGLAAPQKS